MGNHHLHHFILEFGCLSKLSWHLTSPGCHPHWFFPDSGLAWLASNLLIGVTVSSWLADFIRYWSSAYTHSTRFIYHNKWFIHSFLPVDPCTFIKKKTIKQSNNICIDLGLPLHHMTCSSSSPIRCSNTQSTICFSCVIVLESRITSHQFT